MVGDDANTKISSSVSGNQCQEQEYDDYRRKLPKVPIITNIQAFFLLIQGVVGTGILQSVFVFRQGWITGIILTVVIGIICSHCLHILANVSMDFLFLKAEKETINNKANSG